MHEKACRWLVAPGSHWYLRHPGVSLLKSVLFGPTEVGPGPVRVGSEEGHKNSQGWNNHEEDWEKSCLVWRRESSG